MRKKRILTGVSAAALALAISLPAFADANIDLDRDTDIDGDKDVFIDVDSDTSKDYDQDVDIDLDIGQVDWDKEVNLDSEINVSGTFSTPSDAAAIAVIDDTQIVDDNTVIVLDGDTWSNSAEIEEAFSGVGGAISVNVAAGDYNVQGNSLAVAVSDKAAMGLADAETFLHQEVFDHVFDSELSFDGTENEAEIDDAFLSAVGIVSVNVAAGSGNAQRNQLAAAVVQDGQLAQATSGSLQFSNANWGINYSTSNEAEIEGGAFDGSVGVISANLAAGNGNLQANSLAISVDSAALPSFP